MITWLYENIVAPGSKLTILDAGCLIAAIPATVMCKVVLNRAPFSDAAADALCGAESFDAFSVAFRAQFGGAPLTSGSDHLPGPLPWLATCILSLIAAGARFLTSVMVDITVLLEGNRRKYAKLFSSILKLCTYTISFITTMPALAKNEIVSLIERLVLLDLACLSFLPFAAAGAEYKAQDGITITQCFLGLTGFAAVALNFIVASFEEKDVSETQRWLKFAMIGSTFLGVMVTPPPSMQKSEDPPEIAYFAIAKCAQAFCLFAASVFNVARSTLSARDKISYVDI